MRYQCTDCGSISAFMFETFHNIALLGQSWFGADNESRSSFLLASVEVVRALVGRAAVKVVSNDADVRRGGCMLLLLCSARSVSLGVPKPRKSLHHTLESTSTTEAYTTATKKE